MFATEREVKGLVEKELESANRLHPQFVDWHQAYAVLLEEAEEAKDEIRELEERTEKLWKKIKKDDPILEHNVHGIMDAAIKGAMELIQTAAVAKKMERLSEKEGNRMEISVNSNVARKKKWLKRYREKQRTLKRLLAKKELLEEKIVGVRSSRLTATPSGGGRTTAEDLVEEKVELEKRINKIKEKAQRTKEEILEELDRLENSLELELMELYLIDCLSMDEVAEVVERCPRTAYRIYTKAISKLLDSAQVG